jgi:hypothetical protein
VSSVDVDRDPAPIAALPESYRPIFDRLLAACLDDPRIRALWLSGSLARGTADRGSDLDALIAVRDEDLDEFAAHWREWLATITPTLLARELPFAPGSFFSTTEGCERLDVVCERVGDLPTTPYRYRRAVFDRDGLDAVVPEPEPLAGPDVARMQAIVEEFLRIQAIAPFMLWERRDLLVVVSGVQGLQQMLYDLLVESNQPQPPMGIKQWSARLTGEQRALLTALPVAAPDESSLASALRGVVDAMRTRGRAALTRCGGEWPVELDDGVQRFFDRSIP